MLFLDQHNLYFHSETGKTALHLAVEVQDYDIAGM